MNRAKWSLPELKRELSRAEKEFTTFLKQNALDPPINPQINYALYDFLHKDLLQLRHLIAQKEKI